MVHRIAAERIAADDLPDDEFPAPESRYVIVGFNALSACEKRLFTWLRNSGRAEFWWDYDDYYVGNVDHEAGLFLRSNIREYPAPRDTGPHGRFVQAKEVSVVSAPSDSLQCKYVHTFLEGLLRRGLKPDKETAIVLTDESLLLPVLYSIPDEIGAVNVTMGYPLRQTTAYSFVERLLELQRRKRRKKDGTLQFYHSDVVGILNHPYILNRIVSARGADRRYPTQPAGLCGSRADCRSRGYRPYFFPLRTDGRSLPIICNGYLPVSADCRQPKTVRAGASSFR